MKIVHAVLLNLLLIFSVGVFAQDMRCDASEGKPVASLDELPVKAQEILGRAKSGISGIADIGGKFNPSDAIIDDSIPGRRLISGVAGNSYIWLVVEYGGIGHYKKNLEYQLRE